VNILLLKLDSRSHIQYVLNKFLLLVLNKHQFTDFLLGQVSSPLLMEKMRRCQQLSSLGEHAFTTYSRQSLLKVWRYPFLCGCGTFCDVGMQYFLAARCRWQNDKPGQTLFQREVFHPCYACRSWLDVFHLKDLITCTTIQPCNVVCFLQDVDPCDDLSDEDIRTAIQNATGPKNVLFVPEVTLVKV